MIIKSLIKLNKRIVGGIVGEAVSCVLRTACIGVCAAGVVTFIKNKKRLADKAADMGEDWIPAGFRMPEMGEETETITVVLEDDEPEAEEVEEEPPAVAETTAPVAVKRDEPEVCYYTEKGDVWHYARSCSYLKNAEDLRQGSLERAEASGKIRPCARCAARFITE